MSAGMASTRLPVFVPVTELLNPAHWRLALDVEDGRRSVAHPDGPGFSGISFC